MANITYEQFIKNASEYMDVTSIPTHVTKAAHITYNTLPIKSASIILKAHESAEPGAEKIAFEMVCASIVKESMYKKSSLPGTIGKALFHPATHVALSVAGVASDAVSKTRNTVGKAVVPAVEGVTMPNVS